MKNFIAITSFIVASTICASAATVTSTYSYNSSTSAVPVGSVSVTNTWDDGTTSTGSVTGSYTVAGNFGFNSIGGTTGTQDALAPWISLNSKGWNITTTGFSSDAGAKLSEISLVEVNVGAYVYDTKQWLTVAQTDQTISLTATILSGTTSLGTFTGTWDLSSETVFTNKTISLIGSAIDVSSIEDLSVQITMTGTSGLTNVGGALYSVSLIPEPSMFGLLAGLGALALVGARRRRR